jgi:serine/threonine-protein kinase HipA
MSRLRIHYEDLLVGELAEARGGVFFEYSPAFLASRHELSPLTLPLGPGVRARDASPSLRLPGLFEDSLPDQWGRRVMEAWFRRQGVPDHKITPLRMLAYVGDRAMGALRYSPALEIAAPGQIDLEELRGAAAELDQGGEADLALLARAGSSAGGARPKALVHLPPEPEASDGAGRAPAWSGVNPPDGYTPWLVKFDLSADGSAGPGEEAYARLARAAGIDVPPTRLVPAADAEGRARRHFAVRRFDREPGGRRVHHHTLAALLQTGAGDLDYQHLLRATRRLARDEREVWRAYRRAVFNVLAGNRDDHGKNHGFLYENHAWRLGPAYDLTHLSPARLPERGLSVCGERRDAGLPALLRLAETEGLDRKTALSVVEEVAEALRRWPLIAAETGVPEAFARGVSETLRHTLG